MELKSSHARLFLQGRCVGDVHARGSDASWGFGEFRPNEAFADFAAFFGSWSLLMHADEQSPVLTDAASEELRSAEYAIDHLKAELHWVDPPRITPISQLNIDGFLIEWKRN